MDTVFQPDLLNWLFGLGIGTNIGAALVWVPIGAFLGYLWSKTSYWPLHAIHMKLDSLHDKHDKLHESHTHIHTKLDDIYSVISDLQEAVGKPREK